MQVTLSLLSEGLPEVFRQLGIKVAQLRLWNVSVPDKVGPATEIDGCGRQRFIHGQRAVAITADACLVAQRLQHSLAQCNAGVFHAVMGINVQIALHLDIQIDERVPGQKMEHVIEEPDAGGDVSLAGAIEVDADADLRFVGLAVDLGGSWRHGARDSGEQAILLTLSKYRATQANVSSKSTETGFHDAEPNRIIHYLAEPGQNRVDAGGLPPGQRRNLDQRHDHEWPR